ncbi:MAG: glycosyltransferase family 2 protein [Verrucomicrobia bacterium]|nr:glycosyltransferase family 2 protein [Verrucomicrobiota bacterium]MDA1086699.1 glycosyltransferase family 2 protein [Verrucomicrobiota bacterium]
MTTPRLSIVLPSYNEAGNIPLIFARFRDVLAGRDDVEVIIVDNGSTDDTAAVLSAELSRPEHAFARGVTVEVNRGYGFGIMSGVRAAAGECIAWTHADMQTDPKDVLDGFERLAKESDPMRVILKGRRENRALLDEFFTWGMAVISSMALGTRLEDINAQPKMFHRSFLEHLETPPDDFALDLFLLFQAQRKGFRILEQPVIFSDRMHGEAKGGGTMKGKIKLMRRTWGYIMQLRRKIRSGVR